jgi:hypothetical protein
VDTQDKFPPWLAYLVAAAVSAMVLFFFAGLLNLLLGRERVVPARLLRWDVHVGPRRNTVTSFFEGNGHSYTWKSSRVAPVDQKKPLDLVVDGFLWDEIVEIRQDGKTAWKRI